MILFPLRYIYGTEMQEFFDLSGFFVSFSRNFRRNGRCHREKHPVDFTEFAVEQVIESRKKVFEGFEYGSLLIAHS